MLSYHPSENEMQYEQSYGGQRRDYYLPPPLVPPPVVGDWYQSGLHSYMDTPTSSASPMSYHFLPASSYGSSTVRWTFNGQSLINVLTIATLGASEILHNNSSLLHKLPRS